MTRKQPKSIALNAIARHDIEQAMRLIAEKQHEVNLLQLGLERTIEQHTGVNLTSEHWTLDPDHWTLTKE